MSHYVSPLDRVIHAVLWVLAGIAIPVALIVGLGRELMPLVADQKPLIEQFLSQKSGLVIRLGDVSGNWRALSPELDASNVQIFASEHADKPLLTIPSVSTEPDWWATLRDLSPRLRTRINGLALTLAPKPEGGVEVLELSGLGQHNPEQAAKALRWLLAQPSLVLQDNQLRWQTPGRLAQVLHDVRIQQYHHGDYRLDVSFRLAASAPWQRALFIVNGDPLQWQKTPWQGYFQLQDLVAWQPWLSLLPDSWGTELKQGSVRIWLRSPAGLPTEATALLEHTALSLVVPGRGPYDVTRLNGLVSMHRTDTGWYLGADDLQGELNGIILPLRRLAVNYADNRIEVAAARISLTQARALLLHEKLLPKADQDLLETTQPSGFLPRAGLVLTPAASKTGWQLQSANAEFKALTLLKTEHTPGVKGLAGWVEGSADGGLLYLDTRHAEVDLHNFFREVTPVTLLRGGVRWMHHDGAWHIDTDVLQLQNADADVNAQLALHIPDGHAHDAQLELLASLKQGNVVNAYRYVPWPDAGDETLAWLKRALVAGKVDQGSFLYSGPIADAGHGRFDMQLHVSGASLDYVPGWPALHQLDGTVSILGTTLDVVATHARVMNAEASNIHARIPDLGHAVLQVDTDLATDLSDLDKLLAEAPIKSKTALVAADLDLKGPVRAHLGLSVPLAASRSGVGVTVEALLDRAQIGLPGQGLEFTRVTGPVHFDLDQGLDASALDGQFWGRPAQIVLSGEHRGKRWWQQKVAVDVQADTQAMQRWLNTDLSRYVRGVSPVRVGLTIPMAAPGPLSLRINSDLKGMRVTLPMPFGKAAADVLPLQYRGSIGAGDQLASLQVGDDVRAGMTWRDNHLLRALVRVGLPGLAWSDQPGIAIEARTPSVNVNEWKGFLTQLPSAGNGPASTMPTLRRLTLDTDQLQVGNYRFGTTHAVIARQGTAWDVSLRGLQSASLPGWPVTDVHATVNADNDLVELSPLVVKQPNAGFVGSMNWHAGSRGTTTIKGQVDALDLGHILEQFGQSPFITSQSLQAKGELRWTGNPDDFALALVNGTVDAKIVQGRLKDVSGVNLVTRLFGLVNASNILRRLRFDFSDVTKKGLNFDQITLQGTLNAGVIKPSDFDLEGPSMNIHGRGWVNLNTQELDQQLRVAIPVSSAIPVLGFLAGPIVGGALVAADLLLDKQLAKITSVRYRVSGSWDNLKVDDEALESLPSGLPDSVKEVLKDVTKDIPSAAPAEVTKEAH